MRILITALLLTGYSQPAQAGPYGPNGPLGRDEMKVNIRNKCLADFKGVDFSKAQLEENYGYTTSSAQCERIADDNSLYAINSWEECMADKFGFFAGRGYTPESIKVCTEVTMGRYQKYVTKNYYKPRPKAVVKTIANSRSTWRAWYLMCLDKHEYLSRYKPACRNAASLISGISMTPAQAGVEPDLR